MHHTLNPFLVFLQKHCKEQGIPFIVDEDKNLSERIGKQKEESPYRDAKVLVLADEETARKLSNPKDTFSIGVDSGNIGHNNYIRLMEMLRVLIELSRKAKTGEVTEEMIEPFKQEHNKLGITLINGIVVFILPEESPMNYEELRDIYEFQKSA